MAPERDLRVALATMALEHYLWVPFEALPEDFSGSKRDFETV